MLNPIELGTNQVSRTNVCYGSFVTFTKRQPLTVIDKPTKEAIEITSTDSQLVSQTLSGNLKAFEQLVRRYQKLVYNVIYQMILNHETASDLTQDTFIKTFKGLNNFRLEANFKPWLLRIASNSALNFIRDTKELSSLESILEENSHLEPASNVNVEKEVDWRLSQSALKAALAHLSARHRQFFILRYQYDFSYNDIATITGEPETTIKPLLFRIRQRLRQLLVEKMKVYDD